MSSACQCHIDGAYCFYCEVYAPVAKENERLRGALEEVVDVSRWDVRDPELVRCNLIAKEALDYGRKETARTT